MSANGFEAPDYIEPLEAWRAWHVVRRAGSPALRSVVKTTAWPPGQPLVAACLRTRMFPRRRRRPVHASPEPECDCGIYATTLARLGQYVNEGLPADVVACVIGRVSLWGTVLECERGYRASYAYPLELYVPRDERHARLRIDRAALIDQLSLAYGVPAYPVDARPAATPAVLLAESITR
jgi:hypothetical protein